METKTIQMPADENLHLSPESKRGNPKELSKLMQLSITEEKKMVPLDKFKWIADLYTDSIFYIILKIQNEADVINNNWHFIPYNIEKEYQTEHDRKKGYIQFFCIEDLKSRKRLEKIIKKYFQFHVVEWQPFDAAEYKKAIEQTQQPT